jgi:hypothetical protein
VPGRICPDSRCHNTILGAGLRNEIRCDWINRLESTGVSLPTHGTGRCWPKVLETERFRQAYSEHELPAFEQRAQPRVSTAAVKTSEETWNPR